MADNVNNTDRVRQLRHSGRGRQILIYFGKQLRFFVNESGWKVLPMAAVIAALVGMVINRTFFVSMEGGLIGGFALTCMCIWNGCFNSIQAVCRERAIVKREHRSGMHISSYIAAHVIYQFLLCFVQTLLSAYVLRMVNVKVPAEGFMTETMMGDLVISMFLITFAADMMSLLISSIAHTTTGAMTVMPFVLIFQLIFAGSILPLPKWSRPLSKYTISSYGTRAIAAQSGYNELPMTTGWETLVSLSNSDLKATFTVGQLMDMLESPVFEEYRAMEILGEYTSDDAEPTGGDAKIQLNYRLIENSIALELISRAVDDDQDIAMLPSSVADGVTTGARRLTLGNVIGGLLANSKAAQASENHAALTLAQAIDSIKTAAAGEHEGNGANALTFGDLIDLIKFSGVLDDQRDRKLAFSFNINDLFELFGRENVKRVVQQKTAEASQKPEYARTVGNIVRNWGALVGFAALFAILSTVVLEFIDKDKR